MAQDKPFRIGNDLTDSIDSLVWGINKIESDTVKDKRLALDSIEVSFKKSAFKITTANLFKNSNSKLLIDYYFKDTGLIKIEVKEISLRFNWLYTFSHFYFRAGKMVYQYTGNTVAMCMAIPWDKNKPVEENLRNEYLLYGYNLYLNPGLKLQYTLQLFKSLKRPVIALNGMYY